MKNKRLLILILIFILIQCQNLPITAHYSNNDVLTHCQSLSDSSIHISMFVDMKYNHDDSISNYSIFDEEIDQNQSSSCGSSVAFKNSSYYYAQRFRPNLSILTKISLLLSKTGNLHEQATLNVSIRKYLHVDLKTFTIDLSTISSNCSWIDCDFYFCPVDVNESYYIVCHLNHASEQGYIEWFFGINDPYERGCPYYAKNDREWREYTLGSEFPKFDFCFKTFGIANTGPAIPEKPEGPSKGQYGKEYTYSSITTDQEQNNLYYQWNWGDGTTSDWIGPYNNDKCCEATHIWNIKGSYLIKVKAKDEWGIETDWSEPLTTKMEKYKSERLMDFLIHYLLHK
jgi:PKD domain-containing protein